MLAIRAGSSSAPRGVRAGQCLWSTYPDDIPHAESSKRSQRPKSRRSIHSTSNRQDESTTNDMYTSPKSLSKAPAKRRKQALVAAKHFAKALKRASHVGTTENEESTPNPFHQPSTPTEKIDITPLEAIEKIISEENKLYEKRLQRLRSLQKWELEGEEYRKAYKRIFKRIDNAFVMGQLKGIPPKTKGNIKTENRMPKPILIQTILSHKNWGVPEAENKDKTPMESHRMILNLPENELFLFLRDTKLVAEMVMNKGIEFSVIPAEGKGNEGRNVLCAESGLEQLEGLGKVLKARYMTIITVKAEEIHAFTPSAGLIQFISNITGSYVEPWKGNTYRISSMDPAKAEQGKRLLHIAALRSVVLPSIRPLCTISPPNTALKTASSEQHPDNSELYTLLPFFSSLSMILPWESVSTGLAGILYRMRRVTSWTPRPGKREIRHRDERIEDATVQRLLGDGSEEGQIALGEYIDQLKEIAGGDKKVINVKFGHLLLRNDGGSSPLIPPVTGRWPFPLTKFSLSQTSRPIFSATLTPTMVHRALGNPPKHLRKLTYRSIDGNTAITYTYTYPPAVEENDVQPEVETSDKEESHWLAELNRMVQNMEEEDKKKKALSGVIEGEAGQVIKSQATADSGEAGAVPQSEEAMSDTETSEAEEKLDVESESTSDSVLVVIEAKRSIVEEIDMLLPDRPVDARLSLQSISKLDSSTIPTEVTEYFHSLLPSPTEPEPQSRHQTSSAPLTISLPTSGEDTEEFHLEADEDLEMVESRTPGDNAVLRSVRMKDMVLGVDKSTSFTELEFEGDKIPETFWRELASVSRDVNAEISRRGGMMSL